MLMMDGRFGKALKHLITTCSLQKAPNLYPPIISNGLIGKFSKCAYLSLAKCSLATTVWIELGDDGFKSKDNRLMKRWWWWWWWQWSTAIRDHEQRGGSYPWDCSATPACDIFTVRPAGCDQCGVGVWRIPSRYPIQCPSQYPSQHPVQYLSSIHPSINSVSRGYISVSFLTHSSPS